jgi:hypothetical protein
MDRNCVYIDHEWTLVPINSGQDAFYDGLHLYKGKELAKTIMLPDQVPYIEVDQGQGMLYTLDGDKPVDVIYYCANEDEVYFMGLEE